MSTLSQRLARLDAAERRKAMDDRNAKRRAEYAVRHKVLLWDGEPIDPDFDDLCNWYSTGDECQVIPRGTDDE